LLEDICKSSEIMDKILIVGRLLSENKGIDAIIRFTLAHPELHYIIVCGKVRCIRLVKHCSPFINMV
jgi:tetrahydromethanopterin S-methyltransferase subunit A